MRSGLLRGLRYVAAGLANTGLGLAVIFALQHGLGLNPYLVNALGYAAGLCLGFALNRGFVFQSTGGLSGQIGRYGLAVLIAFGVNQLVLFAALNTLSLDKAIAQLLGVAAYSASLFLLSNAWVFRRRLVGEAA